MARGFKPREGSVGYWPKKRAKRIYASYKVHAPSKEAAPLDFACYKAGMVSVSLIDTKPESPTHGKEIFVSATVLDAPPLFVAGTKAYQKTPYGMKEVCAVFSEKLSKDLARKASAPKKIDTKKGIETIEKNIGIVSEIRLVVHTKPREAFGKKTPELFEVSIGGSVKEQWGFAKQRIGTEIKATDVFKTGDFLDAKAVTIGKGFQGPVKRFGIKIRGRKSTKKRRHLGSLGPITPRRVLPVYLPEAGQLGFQTRTEFNKQVLGIGNAKEKAVSPKAGFSNYGIVSGDYIILKGSVPGPEKRLIMLRMGLRAPRKQYAIELRKIVA